MVVRGTRAGAALVVAAVLAAGCTSGPDDERAVDPAPTAGQPTATQAPPPDLTPDVVRDETTALMLVDGAVDVQSQVAGTGTQTTAAVTYQVERSQPAVRDELVASLLEAGWTVEQDRNGERASQLVLVIEAGRLTLTLTEEDPGTTSVAGVLRRG